MHFKKPRRSMPSWLWSCRISSFGLPAIASSSLGARAALWLSRVLSDLTQRRKKYSRKAGKQFLTLCASIYVFYLTEGKFF
jgi:hypothetical protein